MHVKSSKSDTPDEVVEFQALVNALPKVFVSVVTLLSEKLLFANIEQTCESQINQDTVVSMDTR